VVIFTNGAALLYAREFVLRNLVNPISLPLPGNSAFYTNPNATVTCNISSDGTTFIPAQATGTAVVRIDNTNAPWGDATVYNTELLTLAVSGTSGNGPFYLRESPTKASTGKHIVEPAGAAAYKIGSSFDVSLENGFSNGLVWKPANRPIRIDLIVPVCGPPGPLNAAISGSSVILSWSGSTFRLEGSVNISPPIWMDISGNSPVTLSLANPYHFFRLICP
jgi:hypothetical protein